MHKKYQKISDRFFLFTIPYKIKSTLNYLLIFLLIITFKVWHLSFVQYENRVESAKKPQQKTTIEPAKRGTIRDRFNLPLAINTVQYNVSIQYSQIQEIPRIQWETIEGKKQKRYLRKEYIRKLAEKIADEINMDADYLEDLIHSKASLYQQIPFLIKENISEKQYFRLKMLEKDYVGLQAYLSPKRTYPNGLVGGEIIGYLGAINQIEYEKIIQTIKDLQQILIEAEQNGILPEKFSSLKEIKEEIRVLTNKAYSIHDSIGKSGVEAKFESNLRGFYGKRNYLTDARGNFVQELPGEIKALAGQRLMLSISSELQQYAEELLIQRESIGNETSSKKFSPWIKGGAIVAIKPDTGEILALASHPRFNPNDFTPSSDSKQKKINTSSIKQWFETEEYIGTIWDGHESLFRERYNSQIGFYEEKKFLHWKTYIETILPNHPILAKKLTETMSLKQACLLQQKFKKLLSLLHTDKASIAIDTLYLEKEHIPTHAAVNIKVKEEIATSYKKNCQKIQILQKDLHPYLSSIKSNEDKILLIDLSQVAVNAEAISPQLLFHIGHLSLEEYRSLEIAKNIVTKAVKEMVDIAFYEDYFKKWRQENEKEFLKAKRLEEKASKKIAHPYIDYLSEKQNSLNEEFWNRWQLDLLYAFLKGKFPPEGCEPDYLPIFHHLILWHQELEKGAHQHLYWYKSYYTLKNAIEKISSFETLSFLSVMRQFNDLNRPLFGKYKNLKVEGAIQKEKHLAAAFYPKYGFGYARSFAFRQAIPPGSIFKIVTAYEALHQEHDRNNQQIINPSFFEIVDAPFIKEGKHFIGYTKTGIPIPDFYKGGKLIKSHISNIGQVDLIKALEVSSNPYFSLLATEKLSEGNDLAKAAKMFSYGSRTGIDLHGEYAGTIPFDLNHNKTGLFATAIGQHNLTVTPLQTAIMLSSIINGGKILKPKIMNFMIGKRKDDLSFFTYQNLYETLGINFPLFTTLSQGEHKTFVQQIFPQINKTLDMKCYYKNLILEGMKRATLRIHNNQMFNLYKLYNDFPDWVHNLKTMKHYFIGKSSTAEIFEYPSFDAPKPEKLNHIWYAGILFKTLDKPSLLENFEQPELVVVVLLRYGEWGKDALPLAAQIAKKWKEIQEKHLKTAA